MQKYKDISQANLTFLRRSLVEDLNEIQNDDLAINDFLESILMCNKEDYCLMLGVISFALLYHSKYDVYEIFIRRHLDLYSEYHPVLFQYYCKALVLNNKHDQLSEFVKGPISNLKDEWILLLIAEMLCDSHLWSLLGILKPKLTWSGTASKVRYQRIHLRHDISKKYDRPFAMPVYFINLNSDTFKFQRLTGILRENMLNYSRVPGVLAKEMPKYALKLINRSVTLTSQVGAIGCFLGHLNALEQFVESGAEHALILEDDAFFYYKPSEYAISRLLENSFDVLYVNKRMMLQGADLKDPFFADSIYDRLLKFPDSVSGWGGDGYIVSANGARKLLDNISIDKILGHYDGQMGSYGLIGLDGVPFNKALKVGFGFNKRFSIKTKKLNVFCSRLPLIDSSDFGYSSRITFS